MSINNSWILFQTPFWSITFINTSETRYSFYKVNSTLNPTSKKLEDTSELITSWRVLSKDQFNTLSNFYKTSLYKNVRKNTNFETIISEFLEILDDIKQTWTINMISKKSKKTSHINDDLDVLELDSWEFDPFDSFELEDFDSKKEEFIQLYNTLSSDILKLVEDSGMQRHFYSKNIFHINNSRYIFGSQVLTSNNDLIKQVEAELNKFLENSIYYSNIFKEVKVIDSDQWKLFEFVFLWTYHFGDEYFQVLLRRNNEYLKMIENKNIIDELTPRNITSLTKKYQTYQRWVNDSRKKFNSEYKDYQKWKDIVDSFILAINMKIVSLVSKGIK